MTSRYSNRSTHKIAKTFKGGPFDNYKFPLSLSISGGSRTLTFTSGVYTGYYEHAIWVDLRNINTTTINNNIILGYNQLIYFLRDAIIRYTLKKKENGYYEDFELVLV